MIKKTWRDVSKWVVICEKNLLQPLGTINVFDKRGIESCLVWFLEKMTKLKIVQNDIERCLKICYNSLKKFTSPRSYCTQLFTDEKRNENTSRSTANPMMKTLLMNEKNTSTSNSAQFCTRRFLIYWQCSNKKNNRM